MLRQDVILETLFWTVRPSSTTLALALFTRADKPKSYFITSRDTKQEVFVSQVGTLEDVRTLKQATIKGVAIKFSPTTFYKGAAGLNLQPLTASPVHPPLVCMTHFLRSRSLQSAVEHTRSCSDLPKSLLAV